MLARSLTRERAEQVLAARSLTSLVRHNKDSTRMDKYNVKRLKDGENRAANPVTKNGHSDLA